MRMPWREAPPSPPKKVSGTDTTSAQGQDTTRKVSALRIHSIHSPVIMEGTTARTTASPTTTGVYILAKRVISASCLDLREAECSTSSSTLETVDSLKELVTLTFKTPVRLTQPDMTLWPTPTSRGMDSPVRAEVSTVLLPSMTTPSSGMRSPGLTVMTVPSRTFAGSTCFSSPPCSMQA